MEKEPIKKEYSNGEVTITWEPHKCIHSGNCVRGLGKVFDTRRRPWIDQYAASTEEIVNQIQKCPSGALGYYFEEEKETTTDSTKEQLVEVIPNGPLMIYGNLKVQLPDGSSKNQHKISAFCRCGGSQNKPFCDGTHKKINFQG